MRQSGQTRSQTLARSRLLGQLAYAKGLSGTPVHDPDMGAVFDGDLDEAVAHGREWVSGWHDALKIQNDLLVGERTLDLRKLPGNPPIAEPKECQERLRYRKR